MSRPVSWLRLLLAICCLACLSCGHGGQSPAARVPVGAELAWASLPLVPSEGAVGEPLETLAVRGGDVVRIETVSDSPLELAELSRDSGVVETWRAYTPKNHLIYLKASLFTSQVAARPGTLRAAWRGAANDPGYAWFAVEAAALEWSESALGTPFPELAEGGRIDRQRFEQLDAALAAAMQASLQLERDRTSSASLRRVLALRSVRELRPLVGLPYFYFDQPRALRQNPNMDANTGRPAYRIAPGAPVSFVLEGPGIFELLATTSDVSPDPVQILVREANQLRSSTALWPRGARAASASGGTARLTRLRLHLPPGQHVYTLQASRAITASVLVAHPVVHFEDSAAKSESKALDAVVRSCAAPANPTLCALGLALQGRDAEQSSHAGASVGLSYSAAFAQSPPEVRAMLALIVSGAPLAKAPQQSAQTLNESVWTVVGSDEGGSWRANLAASDTPACRAVDHAPWAEVGESPRAAASSNWHGARVLELAVASDRDGELVDLEVDGARLSAHPARGLRLWHIRVHGSSAQVRRLDHGAAHVYPLRSEENGCPRRIAKLRAPQLAANTTELSFGAAAGAPGIEIWLPASTPSAELSVTALGSARPQDQLRLVVTHAPGLSAIDPDGARWTRAARVALPGWASAGVRVRARGAAVRALSRSWRAPVSTPVEEPTAPEPLPEQLDRAGLTALSARILSAPPSERGALYLERALLLARAGRGRGALADARAAQGLLARAPDGEAAVELVTSALRVNPSPPAALPSDVAAFGVEPDFDPAGATGQQPGARAAFEQALSRLGSPSDAEQEFDAGVAATALKAADADALDPRAPLLRARVVAHSRYQEVRSADGPPRRRRFDDVAGDGAVDATDAWGELRPSVAGGGLLAEGSYVVVDAEHPARAQLNGLAPGAALGLDLVCYAREPAAAEACAPTIGLEQQPARSVTLTPGLQRVNLRTGRRYASELSLSVGRSPARFVLLARIVVAHAIPGASELAGVGWVLAPKPHDYRFELAPDRPWGLDATRPRIVRLRAHAPAATEVVAELAGRSWRLPTDGSPEVVVLGTGERLQVRSAGGEASLSVAERVADDHEPMPRPNSPKPAAPAGVARGYVKQLRFDDDSASDWRRAVERSPRPMTPVEDALGTAVVSSGAVVNNMRNNGLPGEGAHAYGYASLGYRRRIERVGLLTHAAGFARFRDGAPTYGAEGSLYWDLAALHIRASTTASLQSQRVGGIAARASRLRGFAEYSYRATSNFFVLPRLGWDAVSVSLRFRPSSLLAVDDEIYDPYRARRPLFVFQQALLWYAPQFNDIFYVRLRATENASAGALSHGSVRPGGFAVLGQLDMSAFVDLTWYAAGDTRTGRATLQETFNLGATYDVWFGRGSLDVAPGISALFRPGDTAYQVVASLTLLGSFHRGLRDFSSLELDFPEQRSDGVPWRGPQRGRP